MESLVGPGVGIAGVSSRRKAPDPHVPGVLHPASMYGRHVWPSILINTALTCYRDLDSPEWAPPSTMWLPVFGSTAPGHPELRQSRPEIPRIEPPSSHRGSFRFAGRAESTHPEPQILRHRHLGAQQSGVETSQTSPDFQTTVSDFLRSRLCPASHQNFQDQRPELASSVGRTAMRDMIFPCLQVAVSSATPMLPQAPATDCPAEEEIVDCWPAGAAARLYIAWEGSS